MGQRSAFNNGILLQPGPWDNGNYPPEGCIVLPEGRRRPKVEAARRQDNAAQRRIISSWPEGKVVIITFLYSRANNMVPDPGTISPKPGTMGPQTPTMNPLFGVRGPRTTQIAPDSVYSILFARLYKNVLY